VQRILILPGAQVQVGTPILELDNIDLRSQMENAEMDWRTEEARLENNIANLQTTRLQLENSVADAQAQLAFAQADLEAYRSLADQGIVAERDMQSRVLAVSRAENTLALSKKQLDSSIKTEATTLAPQRATVNQAKTRYDQLVRQVADLIVKSDMRGQLQAISVEVGAQVGAGAQLARVSDPTRLKAEVRIPETQTRDLAIGLPATIDTRNGNPVKGHVSRIDPAAIGGTVGVDIVLDEALPANARVQMSVDGVVQLQLLENILFVDSPAYGQENSTIQLYKVDPVTSMAHLVRVGIGARSVQHVQVIEGLSEGDQVVLSDMSQYSEWDRIQIRN
jgi:HlyD family secretion protein